jgi:GNAT superfamily N-acetyltransferase
MHAASSSGDISIVHRLDAEISAAEDHELRRLLLACFPYEPGLLTRRFIRQPPTHRWLVRAASGELIAHAAAHDKFISAAGRELRIGGIAEVCVAHYFRGHGLAKKLLVEAHGWMGREGIPFAMLFGQPKVYASSGYAVIENPIQAENALIHHWNPFKGKPMIHAIAAHPWPEGPIDLRGPTF